MAGVDGLIDQLSRNYSRYLRDAVPGLAVGVVALGYVPGLREGLQGTVEALPVAALLGLLVAPGIGQAVEVLSAVVLAGPIHWLADAEEVGGGLRGWVRDNARGLAALAAADIALCQEQLAQRWLRQRTGCPVAVSRWCLALLAEAWLLEQGAGEVRAAILQLYDARALTRSLALVAVGAGGYAGVAWRWGEGWERVGIPWGVIAGLALGLAAGLVMGAAVLERAWCYYTITRCWAQGSVAGWSRSGAPARGEEAPGSGAVAAPWTRGLAGLGAVLGAARGGAGGGR